MQMTDSFINHTETYDDNPTYQWDERFSIDSFAQDIDTYNDELWYNVRIAICGKLGIPLRNGGCKLAPLVFVGRDYPLKTSPCDFHPYKDSTFQTRS